MRSLWENPPAVWRDHLFFLGKGVMSQKCQLVLAWRSFPPNPPVQGKHQNQKSRNLILLTPVGKGGNKKWEKKNRWGKISLLKLSKMGLPTKLKKENIVHLPLLAMGKPPRVFIPASASHTRVNSSQIRRVHYPKVSKLNFSPTMVDKAKAPCGILPLDVRCDQKKTNKMKP